MLEPADLRRAAAWSVRRFAALPDGAWDEPAPEWTRRRTLDHLIDALALYAAYVGSRARGRLTPPRDGDPTALPGHLLAELAATAERLAGLLQAMGARERALHPSGMADRTGWLGMACTEVLVHTWDATGTADDGVEPLAAAVVDRVLPWAPPGRGWARLLQATAVVSRPVRRAA